MKKKIVMFALALVLSIVCTVCLAACDDGSDNTESEPAEIGFMSGTGGTVEGETMSLEVGTTVETIDLAQVIYAKGGAFYTVCEKEDGTLIIPDKIVKLKNGKNKFYVVSEIASKKTTYTLEIWKNYKVTVSYYVNGKLFDDEYVTTHTYLEDHRAPENLDYGMEFLGWDCEGYFVEGYKRFDAKIKYKTVDLSLDANGGICDKQSVKVNLGGTFEFPVPKKDGYTFTGWKLDEQQVTDKDGKGKNIWTVSTQSQVVAGWKANVYEVRFVSNDTEVCDSFDESVTYGKEYTVNYGMLKKLGYRFLGWYKDNQKIGDGYELTFTPDSKNMTIEMRWQYDIACDVFDYYPYGSDTYFFGLIITGIKDKTLTSLEIPQGILGIAEGALNGLANLQELTIPFVGTGSGLIATDSDCAYLFGSVFGKNSYTGGTVISQCSDHEFMSIRTYSFYVPTSLKKVTVLGGNYLDKDPATIHEGAFENCSMLTEIVLGGRTCEIESYAFNGCTSLQKLDLGGAVSSIGKKAFYNCTGLVQIENTESITSVNVDAFENTAWYDAQTDGLVYVGKALYKFKGEMQTDAVIALKKGTVSITDRAFAECTARFAILIPISVTEIPEEAFGGCNLSAYCEANVKPNNWASNWSGDDNSVMWGVDIDELLKELQEEGIDYII